MTNSEKAIYFLSLTSCSINKLKSICSSHVKFLCFLILRGKNLFAPVNREGLGRGGGVSLALRPGLLSLRPCLCCLNFPNQSHFFYINIYTLNEKIIMTRYTYMCDIPGNKIIYIYKI